jgi:enoyl-CoA hydratase/carnithine racemase
MTTPQVPASGPALIVEQRGPVTLVQLNRPEKRNAINRELIDALGDFFDEPPTDTRAIVLHAAGGHFCAGLDLIEKISRKDTQPFDVLKNSRRWHRAFENIQFGDVPVISALQGGVIGGGLELCASTHVRIVEESGYFQLPEAQRGIFVGGGATVRVARIIGAGRMVEMMLSGRRYNAQTALNLGLAHYVVADGTALAFALELAQHIAENSFMSNHAVINSISRIADMSMAEGFMTESYVAGLTNTSGEGTQRISSFFEGRRSLRSGAAGSDARTQAREP